MRIFQIEQNAKFGYVFEEIVLNHFIINNICQ